MNQPQRKLIETSELPAKVAAPLAPKLQMAADGQAAAVASPALALQAKLSRELESSTLMNNGPSVLKGFAVFTAACAGTWVFGALLYLQV